MEYKDINGKIVHLPKKYTEYAENVVDGTIIANKYIKKACERYLSWFDREDLVFCPEKSDRVERFLLKLSHSCGRFANKPFKVLPWQRFALMNMYNWYYRGTEKRVTRNVFIEIGRKAGKTTFLSGIALYQLIIDEEQAEVDCIANSRQQAHILFDSAYNFINKLDPNKNLFKQQRERIMFPSRRGICQVLASDTTKLDGLNASTAILDEVHENKDAKTHQILASSQGARENPMLIMITSAGFNVFGFCYEYRNMCIDILNNLKTDDSQFSLIYEVDEDDDWKNDESCWQKANPSLGATVSYDYLRGQVQMCKNNPTLEVGVATKNFGLWQRTSDVWIPYESIIQCTKDVNLKDFKDCRAYASFDLASVSDLTALSVCIEKDEKYYFKTWYFLPSETVKTSPNSENYKKWIRQGKLIETQGNCTDYAYVLTKIKEIAEILWIENILYDKWNSSQFVISLQEEGLPLQPFSQSLGSFNCPTKELQKLILSNNAVIDNNEITRWCFSNVVIKEDWNQNVKPIKGEYSEGKIDGVIAMIMALAGVLNTPQYSPDIFTI